MAADCVHGGLAYIGVSVGGTDQGAITRTPRKMERACVGNRREQPLESWVNAASLHGELKGHDQSKDRENSGSSCEPHDQRGRGVEGPMRKAGTDNHLKEEIP